MRHGRFPPFGFEKLEFGFREPFETPFWAFFDFRKIRFGDTLKITIPIRTPSENYLEDPVFSGFWYSPPEYILMHYTAVSLARLN